MPTDMKCPICGEIQTEPLVPVQVTRRWNRRSQQGQTRREPVCQHCATAPHDRSSLAQQYQTWGWEESEPVPCEVCGLSVLLVPDKRRKVSTCSDYCRTKSYRKPRTVSLVVTVCEGCGKEMHGRSDRKFCGSTCRQRAYRHRQVEA